MSLGFFNIRSLESSEFPECKASSSTIPWACSIQRSQICASKPAISKLVSAFFLPQKEHSKSSFDIISFSVFNISSELESHRSFHTPQLYLLSSNNHDRYPHRLFRRIGLNALL